ncbi:MAG TPA: restriction endonuclease, partial [Polyangiales bacterium]|nr:restriction endonuclease [Polyangiales bacterium]
RPRFRIRSGRVLLAEWQASRTLARTEQDLLAAADRYGNELRRSLIHKLSELPAAGFAEIVATWLNAEGVTALRAVRRPDSSTSEFHFAGTLKRGSEETRLAIIVVRGNREVTRENVIDVRGSLHHYGQATSAWIVTTARTTSGAREEAAMQGAAPCSLFDGMALATSMERVGVAVRSHVIAHHELDFELFEALGDTQEQRDRRERDEQQRDRDAMRNSMSAPEPNAGGAQNAERAGQPMAAQDDAGEGDEEGDAGSDDADLDVDVDAEDNAEGGRDADWGDEEGEGTGDAGDAGDDEPITDRNGDDDDDDNLDEGDADSDVDPDDGDD